MSIPSLTSLPSMDDVAAVAPALAAYTAEALDADVWTRPGLSVRDRCIVTVSVLIAKAQLPGLPHYFAKALDSGVTPSELSEIITHLAFYTGWMNAYAAVAPLAASLAERGMSPMPLPATPSRLLPLDEETEARRAAMVEQNLGDVAPGVVRYTTELIFRDLWLRPDLAPRDRSLVTVCALTATAQVAQISFHLDRAMDNGLTRAEASEVFTHLAFYTGWPAVMSALPVVKDVFASRRK
ncbi:MAG TPA: carboxymuconolactone decarboxylase family protein [Luteibacter sp.]|uniref:carboxymuconolactone decarboxylase family protein n=1 Tax=Luteibacter sp. TaxID=1886636 RepID=UPI002D0740E1|nr:carboxymuconolactone decarboxylase family protein [Luteibacter sp.]HVI54908.1 carboxymuconolactone decarboxylase family protein [Luteibacter sp.]